MITGIKLKNFGPLTAVVWKNLAPINLVIGGNGSGKTFLLKSLYSAMRTLEEYKRGDVSRTAAEILVDAGASQRRRRGGGRRWFWRMPAWGFGRMPAAMVAVGNAPWPSLPPARSDPFRVLAGTSPRSPAVS